MTRGQTEFNVTEGADAITTGDIELIVDVTKITSYEEFQRHARMLVQAAIKSTRLN